MKDLLISLKIISMALFAIGVVIVLGLINPLLGLIGLLFLFGIAAQIDGQHSLKDWLGF